MTLINKHDSYISKISKETTPRESPNEHKHFIPCTSTFNTSSCQKTSSVRCIKCLRY